MNIMEIFERISNNLYSNYSLTELSKHKGIKGSYRENIIKNFLGDNLTDEFNISSGEIFDSNGNISKQVDIIIYSYKSPVFKMGDFFSYCPIESVRGAIEIKTKLNKGTLIESIQNIIKIKELEEKTPAMTRLGNNNVYCGIFSFSTINPSTIKRYLNEYFITNDISPMLKPDFICSLDKFIAIRSPGDHGIQSDERGDTAFIRSEKDTLLLFYCILYNGLHNMNEQNYNFIRYFGQARWDDY